MKEGGPKSAEELLLQMEAQDMGDMRPRQGYCGSNLSGVNDNHHKETGDRQNDNERDKDDEVDNDDDDDDDALRVEVGNDHIRYPLHLPRPTLLLKKSPKRPSDEFDRHLRLTMSSSFPHLKQRLAQSTRPNS